MFLFFLFSQFFLRTSKVIEKKVVLIKKNECKSSVESVAFQASSISPSSHHNSTVISGVDGEFNLPKQQMKKRYRRENKNKVGTVSPSFEAPVAGFCAKVTDAFIYRCSRDTKAEIIQNHLMKMV